MINEFLIWTGLFKQGKLKEIPLIGIDNWNVEATQHQSFSSYGTIPMGFKYEVDSYNHDKCKPQCMKCHSTVIPKSRFGHDKFFDVWTEPVCFPCGRDPKDCKCEPNTNMDYEHICGICGDHPSSLEWMVGYMRCDKCRNNNERLQSQRYF